MDGAIACSRGRPVAFDGGIADALELTVPNVKTRLHRARLAVRDSLEDYVAGER